MADLALIRATVHGRVQGVSFRFSTREQARALGLTGWVRNLPGRKAVEVEAEGEKNKLEKLVGYLRVGPLGAKVERVEVSWSEYTASHQDFSIRR